MSSILYYDAFFNSEVHTLQAASSYDAQQAAHKFFQSRTRRKIKPYEIAVILVARDGEPVVHNPASLN